MKAIIAGGGLGGLSAAISLAQRGWSVTVFERQPELRAAGSGIYIWENGLRVLKALGAYDEAMKAPFRGLAFEQRDLKDKVIEGGRQPENSRLVTIPRSDLLRSLKHAADRVGVSLRTSSEVVGATSHGELLLPGGMLEAADLAIGADGIWSPVREALGLRLLHEQSLEGCHRVIVPGAQADLGPDGQNKYIETWNGTRRFLITPISENEIYLALTCLTTDAAGARLPVDKESWKASFPRWNHLIDRIEGGVTWGLFSVIKVRSWSSGRTALIGDAAHAQPPNLGQGGGMAMQMGLALGSYLGGVNDRRDIPDALRKWEEKERPMVDHCQKWSCLYSELTNFPDEIRSIIIRNATDNQWIRSQIRRAADGLPTGYDPR